MALCDILYKRLRNTLTYLLAYHTQRFLKANRGCCQHDNTMTMTGAESDKEGLSYADYGKFHKMHRVPL